MLPLICLPPPIACTTSASAVTATPRPTASGSLDPKSGTVIVMTTEPVAITAITLQTPRPIIPANPNPSTHPRHTHKKPASGWRRWPAKFNDSRQGNRD